MTETAKNEKDLRPSIDAYFKKETLEMGGRIFGKSLQYAGIHCLRRRKMITLFCRIIKVDWHSYTMKTAFS